MTAKQVSKDSEIRIPGADAHAQAVQEEQAVQAAVDIIQDTPPEALFAPAEHPVEVLKPTQPKPGSVIMSDGSWVAIDPTGVAVPYVGGWTEFVARDPGLMIELGDVQVRFDLGRVRVPDPVASRLKRHFLYNTDKFFTADEVAIIGNEIVSYRDHKAFSENVSRMKSGQVAMFATKLTPNLVMNFGDWEVRFEDGYAAVPLDKLERFERHMFVVEQRVTRLQAV
jgi:hypothetical protein